MKENFMMKRFYCKTNEITKEKPYNGSLITKKLSLAVSKCTINTLILLVIFVINTMVKSVYNFDLPVKCEDNQYYDTLLFVCRECPSGEVISPDRLSCTCPKTSIFTYSDNTLLPNLADIAKNRQCTPCAPGLTSNRDQTLCQACFTEISNNHGDCLCPEGSVIQEFNTLTGEYLNSKSCFTCPEGEYPFQGENIPLYECSKCPPKKIYNTNTIPWSCECDANLYTEYGGECFEKNEANFLNTEYPASSATSIEMTDGEDINSDAKTSETISESDTIREFYFKSGFNCLKSLDRKSCQTLANLCVLQMYDLQSEVCKLYKFINDRQPLSENNSLGGLGKRQNVPWLYYEGNSTQIINDTEKIKFTPSFDPDDPLYVNKMEMYLASYTLEGDFLGIEPLTTQLNLCTNEYQVDYLKFGDSIRIECEIDYFRFTRANYTTLFYELFLYDPIAKDYIDVPLKIDNIKNEEASWGSNNSTTPDKWILTRRFFMVDNIGGLEGFGSYFDKTIVPTAIRYPHLLKFQFVLQNREDPRIFVPYLELYYKSKIESLVRDLPTSIVFFEAQYTMNIDHLIYVFQSIFITLNMIILVHLIIKMNSYYMLNPPRLSPDSQLYCYSFLVRIFTTLFQLWGFYMFWFTICITGYFWIFLKLQYQVFILLYPVNPEAWWDNNRPFDVIFGLGCTCYFFYIIHKIVQQSNVDIFFIDWEQDKNIITKNAEHKTTTKYRGVWRQVFLANQLNQLQSKRRISIEFAFAILTLLWYHFEWEVHSFNSATLRTSKKSPDAYLMAYFLAGFILIAIGLVYICGRYILDVVYPVSSKKLAFMDLLSISNTSLFILDSSLHGYYVHGQSPSGKSDSTMEELLQFIEEESEGKSKNRNLVDKDSIQTFEIYISYKMRKNYDGLFAMQAETMFSSAETKDKMINQTRMTNLFKILPKNFPFKFVLNLKDFMNTELKEKIQKVSYQPQKYVQKKSLLQRFLNLPPVKLAEEDSEDMVFYKDRNDSFDSVTLFGIDWEYYLFNIYTFQMFLLTMENAAFSMMLTLILDMILKGFRSFCGEKNLSKKTIIDNRFFA